MSPLSTKPTVLRWTRFKSDSHGTGPEKRAAQIRWLCEEAGVALMDLLPAADFPRLRARLMGAWLRLRLGSHAAVDSAGLGLLGYRYFFFDSAVRRHPDSRLIIWETTYDDVMPYVARRRGKRLLAVPHNLEALVSGKVFANHAYNPLADLAAEIRRLGRADAVFTISREERWLLEARAVAARYLPFYPEPALEKECLAIREARPAPNAAQPLLLIGSAFNTATAEGMRRQLEWLRGAARHVVVVGPQTDRILGDFASNRVSVLGTVPRERLAEIMTASAALLIHTKGGAGAVTRIPEALLAGLPVIANANALRDCHGTAGTYRYETREEFLRLAAQPLPVPPAPARPSHDEALFQSTLRELAAPEAPPPT
jgi:glycosyltransferase involved in cell wall biosynthesis